MSNDDWRMSNDGIASLYLLFLGEIEPVEAELGINFVKNKHR